MSRAPVSSSGECHAPLGLQPCVPVAGSRAPSTPLIVWRCHGSLPHRGYSETALQKRVLTSETWAALHHGRPSPCALQAAGPFRARRSGCGSVTHVARLHEAVSPTSGPALKVARRLQRGRTTPSTAVSPVYAGCGRVDNRLPLVRSTGDYHSRRGVLPRRTALPLTRVAWSPLTLSRLQQSAHIHTVSPRRCLARLSAPRNQP